MIIGVLLLATILLVSPVFSDEIEYTDVLLIHEQNQEYDLAIKRYTERLTEFEAEFGSYAEQLIDPLLGLARSYKATDDYLPAIAAIERAQHLSHRQNGVYALRQLEGTELMIQIYLQQREAERADRLQRFGLFVTEHNVGETMDLLPALDKISQWYIETSQFNRARRTLERSLEIVTNQAGERDPRQLPSIIQLAKIKRLQNSRCCSYKVLQQALEILENPDPNADISDETRTQVYLDLADSYTLANKGDRAAQYYRLAWQSMPADERIQRFSETQKIVQSDTLNDRLPNNLKVYRPGKNRLGRNQFELLSLSEQLELESLPPQEFALLQNNNDHKVRIRDKNSPGAFNNEKITRVIGYPFQFIEEQLLNILPASLKSERLHQFRIELDFTVGRDGRIDDITVSSPISTHKLTRLMRQVLRKSRFRPRLVDGEPVKTRHVKLYQSFSL